MGSNKSTPSAARKASKKAATTTGPRGAVTKASSKPAPQKKAASATGNPHGADVAFVKARINRIKSSFYEVGEALARLEEPTAHESLGHASFHALVKKDLRMSTQLADRLVAIAKHLSRDLATSVGQRHAWALVRLARPVTLADPYPKDKRKTLVLPSGDKLRIPTAEARAKMAETAAATKAERSRRGRTTTAVERYIGAEVDACLKAIGIDKARVRTVATRPGQVANLRIELPLSDLDAVCKVVCPK